MFVVFSAAILLRLYKLTQHTIFLGDQGRDAIIIRRILTLEHFPAIGAPTSIGQVYLGPFYYYFIAPFLLFFNFNPVGLSFGVAILSIVAAFISYLLVKKNLNRETALIFLILLGFSFVNIQLSRFSWNPNLLPAFAFFTIFFFYKTLCEKKLLFPLLFGAFFAFSFQLHYLAALLLPAFLILTILSLAKGFSLIIRLAVAVAGFLFFSTPLLIFDLRHNFLNSTNFLKLFRQQNVVSSNNYVSRIVEVTTSFINHFLAVDFPPTLAVFILIVLFIFGFVIIKKRGGLFFSVFFTAFYVFILAFALLDSPRYEHYFGPASYSFFIIVAYLSSVLTKNKAYLAKVPVFILIAFYLLFNLKKAAAFFRPGNQQIKHAQQIANLIYTQIRATPYQLVAIPQNETETEYRYFLELTDKKPLPDNTLQEPQELFVICKQKPCNVLGHPQWQIASFSNAKIVKIWNVDNLKIYKLIHKK